MGKNKYQNLSQVKKVVQEREVGDIEESGGTCAGCKCCSPTGSAKLCSNCRRGTNDHKKLAKPKI